MKIIAIRIKKNIIFWKIIKNFKKNIRNFLQMPNKLFSKNKQINKSN